MRFKSRKSLFPNKTKRPPQSATRMRDRRSRIFRLRFFFDSFRLPPTSNRHDSTKFKSDFLIETVDSCESEVQNALSSAGLRPALRNHAQVNPFLTLHHDSWTSFEAEDATKAFLLEQTMRHARHSNESAGIDA